MHGHLNVKFIVTGTDEPGRGHVSGEMKAPTPLILGRSLSVKLCLSLRQLATCTLMELIRHYCNNVVPTNVVLIY